MDRAMPEAIAYNADPKAEVDLPPQSALDSIHAQIAEEVEAILELNRFTSNLVDRIYGNQPEPGNQGREQLYGDGHICSIGAQLDRLRTARSALADNLTRLHLLA